MRKRPLFIILSLVIIFGTIWLGPQPDVDEYTTAPQLPQDLVYYINSTESRYSDLVPGTEKVIFWADSSITQTAYSVIYLHGYSATRQETAPLSDSIASRLNANLYYTRLAGHGRSGNAMAEATVNDWFRDVREAYEIGTRIGKKIIVIGVSTGGTLAVWLAQQPWANELAAVILISPNFGPKNGASELLTLPWAPVFIPWIIGDEQYWEPQNPDHGQYWTNQYPTEALFPMMALVNYVRSSDLATFSTPTLVIYSPLDQVVDAEKTAQVIDKISWKVKTVISVTDSINSENHVLAGRILAPHHTDFMVTAIMDFLSEYVD